MNYYRIAQRKYKKAVRVSKLLRYIPNIRMIAVVNSLSCNHALPDSDIDLLIVVKRGHVWGVRFLSIIMLMALRLRPRDPFQSYGYKKDKVCLAFFLSDDNLNVWKYKICPDDRYLGEWVRSVKPVYVEDKLDRRFFEENQWAFAHYTSPPFVSNYKRRVRYSLLKRLSDGIGTLVSERICKYIQLKKMPLCIRERACVWDTCVIISDKILKFHANDRRLEYNLKCKVQNPK